MPNWCSNFINIEGSKTKIAKIKKAIEDAPKHEDKPGVFQALVGRDTSITEEEYDKGAWYQSNLDRWGCKWDIGWGDIDFNIYEDSISFNCSTAWSPPTGFCKLLQEKYGVFVRCEFEEGGCDFAGYYEVSKDGEVDEETYSYLEGIYILDKDNFWFEMESRIEYAVDDDETFEDFIEGELKDFLPEPALNELKEMFEEEVNRRKED